MLTVDSDYEVDFRAPDLSGYTFLGATHWDGVVSFGKLPDDRLLITTASLLSYPQVYKFGLSCGMFLYKNSWTLPYINSALLMGQALFDVFSSPWEGILSRIVANPVMLSYLVIAAPLWEEYFKATFPGGKWIIAATEAYTAYSMIGWAAIPYKFLLHYLLTTHGAYGYSVAKHSLWNLFAFNQVTWAKGAN